MQKQTALYCSFCGKSHHDVAQLIAGPKVFICNECVGVCIEVLGASREWCDNEIANLRRLRRQARTRQGEMPPRREGWHGSLLA